MEKQVQSSFSQNELFLPLRKDISRRVLKAFDLKFSGLLELTKFIVMNEGICHVILRIEVIKINVSQLKLRNVRYIVVRVLHFQILQNPSFITAGHLFTLEIIQVKRQFLYIFIYQ